MKIGVISLGCDKNRIDTENMLAYLQEDGHYLVQDPNEAEILVVNTCAFIESAKKEAIDTIFEYLEYKKTGKCKYFIVTGCLSQRYMEELYDELVEVDLFIGTTNYHKLPELIRQLIKTNKRTYLKNDINDRYFSSKRVLSTPYHYAYIKIAEGCNNKCTYCAIPSIRGKYTSRPIEEIVSEARYLVDNYGIKELILVAQDVSIYGQDIYGKVNLIELLKELCDINVEWIRLLYLYPENINDELLQFMASNDKICKYLDMPLQHVSDRILKLMGRRVNKEKIDSLFANIEKYNCFTIRTTFIAGFPQETEEDFNILLDFIKEGKINYAGCFAYSCEDGTAAARLPGQIDESIKEDRVKKFYKLQNKMTDKYLKNRVGKVFEVIYEGIDYDKQLFYGRTQYDAPDVDCKVYFSSDFAVDIGGMYKVKIDKVKDMDCFGKTIIQED